MHIKTSGVQFERYLTLWFLVQPNSSTFEMSILIYLMHLHWPLPTTAELLHQGKEVRATNITLIVTAHFQTDSLGTQVQASIVGAGLTCRPAPLVLSTWHAYSSLALTATNFLGITSTVNSWFTCASTYGRCRPNIYSPNSLLSAWPHYYRLLFT